MRDGQTGLDKIKLDQTRISPYILIIDHNLNLLKEQILIFKKKS